MVSYPGVSKTGTWGFIWGAGEVKENHKGDGPGQSSREIAYLEVKESDAYALPRIHMTEQKLTQKLKG